MSEIQLLRALVTERLAVAADEIFGLVEQTIAEFREEAVRSKSEILELREELNSLKTYLCTGLYLLRLYDMCHIYLDLYCMFKEIINQVP